MLKLEPIEIILRAIPEGFIYLLGVYIFSNIRIEKKKYVISSLISGISIYIFRALPVSYGVHTVLTILLVVFLGMYYNNLEAFEAIKSTIFIFITQFLSEGLNVLIIKLIPGINLSNMFSVPLYKNLLGIPSLMISLLILLGVKKIIYKRKMKENE